MGVLIGMGKRSRTSSPQVPDILVPVVQADAEAAAAKAKEMKTRLRDRSGNTSTGELRLLDCIPMEIYHGNEDFFADDDNVRRWLRENSALQVGKL